MISELNLFSNLKEAWESSTLNDNRFAAALMGIEWDYQFSADGGHCFTKGDFCLTIPTLDPFGAYCWKPFAITSDGSLLEF